MLVVQRDIDEVIVIETPLGEIEIMLVDVRGGGARIGIAAPKAWPVNRKEIAERIKEERAEAARVAAVKASAKGAAL